MEEMHGVVDQCLLEKYSRTLQGRQGGGRGERHRGVGRDKKERESKEEIGKEKRK